MFDLEKWISDFLRYKGMSADQPISDERAFYAEFIAYVFSAGSGFVVKDVPSLDALMGGFFKAKGINPDTPIAQGGEVEFYGQFAGWVYSQGQLAPKPPQSPTTLPSDDVLRDIGVARPRLRAPGGGTLSGGGGGGGGGGLAGKIGNKW